MSTASSASLVSIDEFCSQLRKLPPSAFEEIETVRNFLRTHPVRPDTLEKYLCWDRQHYTRNLIDKTPLYELIAICWDIGQQSSIHNHHNQNCWMAAPIGRLRVQNYRTLSEDLQKGRCDLAPSDSVEMNPTDPCAVDPREPVHKVFNPKEYDQRAVSLHVYSKPFDRCVVYSAEQHTCGEIELHYTTEYGVPVQD